MDRYLEVKHVTKKYGSLMALNDVSIKFDKGVYGLLGQNGAGKSTLIKIISGTLSSDEGEVLYQGQKIDELKEEYREVLGYMPQQQMMDNSYTVESFMYYIAALKGIKQPRDVIEQLLTQFNLIHLKKKQINTLSGGMKQRVLISQALLNNPKILLLDEPTAGLDPIERRNFRKIISEISQSRTVILATHVISDIEFISERILMLDKGVLLTNSNQLELLEQTKTYISNRSISELMPEDETIKLVNTTVINGEVLTRFISKRSYDNQVPTTLDDVYLDWLEVHETRT